MKQIVNYIIEKLIINKESKQKSKLSAEDYKKYFGEGQICNINSIFATINNKYFLKLGKNDIDQLKQDISKYFTEDNILYYKYSKSNDENSKLNDDIAKQLGPSKKGLYQKVFYLKNIGFYIKKFENPNGIVLIIKEFYSKQNNINGTVKNYIYFFKLCEN